MVGFRSNSNAEVVKSIRVPAALCGVYGLKPTFGRLSRRGTFPFVHSLDHVGPFARSVADLAATYDVLQGPDALDAACAQRPVEPVSSVLDGAPPTAAVLGGFFERARAVFVHGRHTAVHRERQAGECVAEQHALHLSQRQHTFDAAVALGGLQQSAALRIATFASMASRVPPKSTGNR